MSDKAEILRQVMVDTSTSQVELAKLSGVHQPSISQFLSGKTEMSDSMLERLLMCMQFELEVMRRPVRTELDRASQRRWLFHRELAAQLTLQTWQIWRPTMAGNIAQLRTAVHGQPHERNLERWTRLVEGDDLTAVRHVMLARDPDSVAMREVSPMRGLLEESDRRRILESAQR